MSNVLAFPTKAPPPKPDWWIKNVPQIAAVSRAVHTKPAMMLVEVEPCK